MLGVEAVSKTYGDHVVIDDVSCSVGAGEIAALLGPNGAGKTTLLSIIAGLVTPDAGVVTICGHNVATERRAAMANVGIAPQETAVQGALCSRENLQFAAELFGVRRKDVAARVAWAIEAMDLGEFADRPAQKLSGGERRRLHAALAIVGRPKVLLLDEPTVGSDIATRSRVLDVVRDLADEGAAVLYTTHYLPEVEELDARVMILDKGVIIADGTVQALLDQHAATSVELTFDGPAPQLTHPRARVEVTDSVVRAAGEPVAQVAAELLTSLGSDSGQLMTIEIVPGNLDSVFLSLTGRRYESDGEPL